MIIKVCKKILPLFLAIIVAFTLNTLPVLAVSQSEVASTSASLNQVAARYSTALGRLYRIESQMRQTQAKLDAAVVEQQRCQQVLNDRVRSIYRHGSIGFLDVIFNAGSFQDFVLRLDLLRRISKLDREMLEKAARAKAEVERRKNELAAQRKEQRKVTKQLASAKAKLERTLSQQKQALAKQESEAARQRQAQRRKSTYRTAYQSSRSSGGYRIGGFVFPVRGPHAYSNDWGAPRSGGRRHQGTDIMAPHGTPVVACVSGTVSRGSGGSAGLYIYLHGDDGNTYFYAHLSGYAASGHVSAGTVIGYVGSTGNASGGAPHLHFEIHPGGGRAVNSYPTLRGAG